jgi:hypothetical protein
MRGKFGILLFGGAMLTGCDRTVTASADVFCFTSVEPALVVVIRDSVTSEPLAGGAAGVARDGAYQDSLRPSAFTAMGLMVARSGADERPGNYRVSIEHPGYRPWSSGVVSVKRNVCHVETVTLHARLQREP